MGMHLGQSHLETARCLRLLGTAENEMARRMEHKRQIHEQMVESGAREGQRVSE